MYGEKTMDHSNVQQRLQRFRRGDFSIQDKPRCGRLTTATEEAIEKLIRDNRCIITSQLMNYLDMPKESVLTVVEHLGYQKICARWVLRLLTKEMRIRKEVCDNLLEHFAGDIPHFRVMQNSLRVSGSCVMTNLRSFTNMHLCHGKNVGCNVVKPMDPTLSVFSLKPKVQGCYPPTFMIQPLKAGELQAIVRYLLTDLCR